MRQQQTILATGYTDFNKDLKRYATSKTNDLALADDLLQNTFLKTWSYLVRGGKIDTMEAFLYHILKALIIDEYRKRKSSSLDVLLEKGFEPSLDDTHRSADVMDGKQVIILIDKLPVIYRKVMHMRYVRDLSLKEISVLTGQSKNTVAVQTHRGLEKLKALYVASETNIGQK